MSNWSGAALSTSCLKRSSDLERKSGGGAAVEKRSRVFCAAAGALMDADLPAAVPWLALAAVPVASLLLVPGPVPAVRKKSGALGAASD